MADSSEYRLFETHEFLSKLDRLPSPQATAIRTKLRGRVYPQMRTQPFHGANIRKLRGFAAGVRRYRTGTTAPDECAERCPVSRYVRG